MKKLIAIDLDGTTLNAQSLISPKTEQTLKKAIDNGHYVSIATGRPYRMSHQFYQQLGLTTPMVNFNGALVHIPEKKWDLESEANIERDLVFDILAQKKELQLDFVAAENKETFYIDTLDGFDPKFFASKATLDNLLTAKNLRTNPTSMMVRTTPNQAEKAAEVYTYVCAQGGVRQTISDADLWRLAEAFGVTPKVGYLEEKVSKRRKL